MGEPREDRDRSERQDEWEALKIYFEFFKHFTTLTTAVGLIFLGVFRGLEVEPRGMIVVLVALAVPLVLSLAGMCNVMVHAEEWGFWKFDFDRDPGHVPLALMAFTLVTFVAALLAVVVVLSPPTGTGGCGFPDPFC